MIVRVLDATDELQFESFLAAHADTSMFLRANARRAGLVYQPESLHATYVGAFRQNTLAGVLAHCWNGMILVQASDHIEELARACVAWSGRAVTGFAGPAEQVRRARSALALDSQPAIMAADEWLYSLPLSQLMIPDSLSSSAILCRAPLPAERDELCAWRAAYDVETLGASDSAETRLRAAKVLDAQIADSNVWVAIVDGRPVSLSAFNAALPDIVQLGGIYTPPALRGRGYAKAAVAGSLLAARDRGTVRAVLFTSNPNAARSYEAVGFRRTGDYGLILLKS